MRGPTLLALLLTGCADGASSGDIDHDPGQCPDWLGLEDGRTWTWRPASGPDDGRRVDGTVRFDDNSVVLRRSWRWELPDRTAEGWTEVEGRCTAEGFEWLREQTDESSIPTSSANPTFIQETRRYIRRPLWMPASPVSDSVWTSSVSGQFESNYAPDNDFQETWNMSLGGAEVRSVDAGDVEAVPLGRTLVAGGEPTIWWYAPGVGMVEGDGLLLETVDGASLP